MMASDGRGAKGAQVRPMAEGAVERRAENRNRRRWAVGGAVGALAVVVAIAAVLARRDEVAAPERGASFGEVAVEDANLTLRDFLAGRGTATSHYDAALLEDRGRLLRFGVRAVGLAGERCRVVWSLTDAATGAPAGGTLWKVTDVPGWPTGDLFPRAAEERLDGEIWVPLPTGAGPFTVTVRLVDGSGIRLAETFAEFSLVRPPRNPDDRSLPASSPAA